MKNKLLITTALLVALSLPIPGLADDKKSLEPGEWPVTVENTVKNILLAMSDEDKQLVKKTSKEDLVKFHHGWGTGIRNHYGLWRGNKKLIESACGKPCHPDDASMLIIEAVWKELQK